MNQQLIVAASTSIEAMQQVPRTKLWNFIEPFNQTMENLRITNSSKQVVLCMHHCIHTKSADSLIHKRKVVFRIDSDEESYTVMYDITRRRGSFRVILKQLYGTWNSPESYKSNVFKLKEVSHLIEEMLELEYLNEII